MRRWPVFDGGRHGGVGELKDVLFVDGRFMGKRTADWNFKLVDDGSEQYASM